MRMEALALSHEPFPADPERARELAVAFTTEARLVRKLTQSVLDQRDAIAENTVESIEASVFALQRILQTLGQAKRNRAHLLEILGWHGVGLESLPEVAGDAYTAELSVARDDLMEAVAHLRRELMLNADILNTVLSGGEAFLRAVTGAESASGYGQGGPPQAAQGQALMMDRVV